MRRVARDRCHRGEADRYCAELHEITVTNVSAPGVSVSPIDYRGPGSVPDQQFLPQAIHHARDQELTGAQIGELLNTTAATAARAAGTSHDQLDKDHEPAGQLGVARGMVGDADAIPAISPRCPNTHGRIDIPLTAA